MPDDDNITELRILRVVDDAEAGGIALADLSIRLNLRIVDVRRVIASALERGTIEIDRDAGHVLTDMGRARIAELRTWCDAHRVVIRRGALSHSDGI